MANLIPKKLAKHNLGTARELSEALGISRQWAYCILRGHMTVKTAKRIAKAIEIPWWLIHEWRGTKTNGK